MHCLYTCTVAMKSYLQDLNSRQRPGGEAPGREEIRHTLNLGTSPKYSLAYLVRTSIHPRPFSHCPLFRPPHASIVHPTALAVGALGVSRIIGYLARPLRPIPVRLVQCRPRVRSGQRRRSPCGICLLMSISSWHHLAFPSPDEGHRRVRALLGRLGPRSFRASASRIRKATERSHAAVLPTRATRSPLRQPAPAQPLTLMRQTR
jgi:hypothetical protein